MNTKHFFTGLIASSVLVFSFTNFNKENRTSRNENREISQTNEKKPKNQNADGENTIQVAILLDTSGSMDGLIEQAKSRLWNIVNTLTTLKYDGKSPKIEIALYEYGNDGIDNRNWIRKVTPLTQDLDLISEKLFALRTNGGTEYCGAVIKSATNELDWNGNDKSMKLIYIAGNEEFNQEGINYKEAISDAKKKNIFVNTIFCGNREEGIRTFWQDGANLGGGKFFNIDSNQKVIFIETPYDIRISECNVRLNDTYIGYGSYGYEKKAMQVQQDVNAESVSSSNKIERAVSKTKKSAYNNANWDIVDKAEADKNFVKTVNKKDLPKELQNKSTEELEKYIQQKSAERTQLQKKISDLANKRQQYIDAEMKKQSGSETDDLGKAIEKSIHELATKNGYVY